MAQTLTRFTWLWRLLARQPLRVSLRVDHEFPGSHLIWDMENASPRPIILTKLIVRTGGGSSETLPLELPHVLAPGDRLVVPTDVDWSLLGAKSIAAGDVDGREYDAPRRQLAAVHAQLRDSIRRPPPSTLSAREFLTGAADLMFGMALLGLGVFMLIWVIATG